MKKFVCILVAFAIVLSMFPAFSEEAVSFFQLGDFNENVVKLHQKLIELGLLSGDPNDPYSVVTENDIKILQTAMGWDVTGLIYGQDELDAILVKDVYSSFGNVLRNSDDLQIAEKSDYEKGIWRAASDGTGIREVIDLADVTPIDGIISGFHIIGSGDDGKYTEVALDRIPVVFGAKYHLSCYARGTGTLTIQHGRKPYIRKKFEVTSDWQEYSTTFTIGYKDGSTVDKAITNVYFGVAAKLDSDIEICGMKLEVEPSSLAVKKNILYNTVTPQIGKSDYENGVWRAASGGAAIREVMELPDAPAEDIISAIHIISSAEDTKNSDVAIDSVPVEVGETYIMSCYARGSGKVELQHGKKPYPREIFDVTDDWQIYSVEFTIGNNDGSTEEEPSTSIYLGVPKGVENDVTICGMSLVKK